MCIRKTTVYQEKKYKLLPDSTVNEAILEDNWDDILRFMATIILRITPASQLFQRLNSNAQKHPLYKSLNEFGKIIETLYVLRDIDEVGLRQSTGRELNKWKHINNFNDAVYKENNHVMQQETREMHLSPMVAEGLFKTISLATTICSGPNRLSIRRRENSGRLS